MAWRSPSAIRLGALAAQLADQSFTYREIGATRHPEALPPGYTHDRRTIRIGGQPGAFDAGRSALCTWQAHKALGATLTPEEPALHPRQVVLVAIPIGPFRIIAPCRIVYVTDEARRFGFAYGTLPGHPECGEESFHIVEESSGDVTFEIVAFSRPDGWAIRLGGPVARWMQVRATTRYLQGLRRHVESHS